MLAWFVLGWMYGLQENFESFWINGKNGICGVWYVFEHVKWCLIVCLNYWNKWYGMTLWFDELGLGFGCWKTCKLFRNEGGQSTECTFSRLSGVKFSHQLTVSVDCSWIFQVIGGQSTSVGTIDQLRNAKSIGRKLSKISWLIGKRHSAERGTVDWPT